MPLLIADQKLPLDWTEESLPKLLAHAYGVSPEEVHSCRIVRRAIDARKRGDVHFTVNIEAELPKKAEQRLLRTDPAHITELTRTPVEPLAPGTEAPKGRIVVVGAGPGGLFAARLLAENGYCPLLIERGRPVEERAQDVARFWNGGALDENSNVMFGEGGAGTFSDGKLTSRSKDPRVPTVLAQLIAHGAPEDIAVNAKPHIGTDRLRLVVSSMRKEIERLGGEVRFSACLSGVEGADGRLSAIRVQTAAGEERIPCAALVLAIGQGARDTYRMLAARGVAMAPKAFAAGVRIEHPQKMIDEAQFGAFAGHPRLCAAEYRLSAKSGARGVYTFCMCPGGQVVSSASENGQIVTNGMSNFARDGENANAAIVVQVNPEDYASADPLSGVQFAERIERACYLAGGGTGFAPASRAADYLAKRKPHGFGAVHPTFRPGVTPANLWDALPEFMAAGVRDGILAFSRQLRGFDMGDAVLTAAETRTSAPVRILRDEAGESVSLPGLYPVGEGAGYAGGIVSAAIDALRAAERIVRRYRPERQDAR